MGQALEMNIPRTLDEVCDPSRLALIVYDMQAGIIGQIRDGERITAQVVEVIGTARDAGIRIFFTRHLSLPKELMGVFQMRMAMEWQHVDTPNEIQPWFLRDAPAFQLTPEMAPRPSEGVVDKITMSAFEGTWLAIALRDCGINAFAIVGVAMEIGIEPTVRHAADLGFIPVVVTDACGAGNAEAAQRSVESLRFTGDALMTDVDAFCNALRRTMPPK